MDYMWHTHHQQHQSGKIHFPPTSLVLIVDLCPSSLPRYPPFLAIGYTLPWLKQPTAQIFFNPHQTFHHAQPQNSLNSASPTDADNDKNASLRRNSCERIAPPTALPYYKSSAFKPVLGAHRTPLFNDHLFGGSVLGSSLPPEPNTLRSDDADTATDNDL